jgi:hypothetical protein
MIDFTPKTETHKFTLGLWTVGSIGHVIPLAGLFVRQKTPAETGLPAGGGPCLWRKLSR